jgi:hypothetical protein
VVVSKCPIAECREVVVSAVVTVVTVVAVVVDRAAIVVAGVDFMKPFWTKFTFKILIWLNFGL